MQKYVAIIKKKMFKRVVGFFFRKKWTSKAIVLEKY